MWLIVGLGNPGPKYEHNRHNVGFRVVDRLLSRCHGPSYQSAFSGQTSKVNLAGHSAQLLKPLTFMNLSGQSVQAAAHFHKIETDHIIVVHDELDIPFSEIRVKKGGGHGGHNGLRDISRVLGPEFLRIRMGIGRPKFKGAEAGYVLSDYSKEEEKELAFQLETACEVAESLIANGLETTQMHYNRKSALAKPK